MKRQTAIFLGILCIALFAAACVELYSESNGGSLDKTETESSQSDFQEGTETAEFETAEPETTESETAELYESPIDFTTLQSENSDICAWVEIPGTEISYPVLRHEGDNSYYLTRDSEGQKSSDGSIFVEDYNEPDFEDPVTVLYGHNMKSGAMFGELQSYFSDGEWFSENLTIYVYLPDKTVQYAVFAAVPYSNKHILYYNNFYNERQFNSFFDGIYAIRSLTANFNSENNPQFGDHVLILSTCLNGDRTQRYLVMAKETK